jgi:hypothetical protein
MISKIKEIIQSYAIAMNPTPEQKYVAEVRLQMCMNCEFWKSSPIEHCSVCGCATKGKVFSPVGSEACPKGKWII